MECSLMILNWLMYQLIIKKEDSFKKENYRSVSILPLMSRVFERILYKQYDSFMTTKLSTVEPLQNGHLRDRSFCPL